MKTETQPISKHLLGKVLTDFSVIGEDTIKKLALTETTVEVIKHPSTMTADELAQVETEEALSLPEAYRITLLAEWSKMPRKKLNADPIAVWESVYGKQTIAVNGAAA